MVMERMSGGEDGDNVGPTVLQQVRGTGSKPQGERLVQTVLPLLDEGQQIQRAQM